MNKLWIAAGVAAGVALAAGPATAQKKYTMKIGMPTINDSNHFSANWVKEELEKRSGGRIKVGVFPAGQLGKIPRQIEGIQFGTQEAFNIPPGFFVGINKAFMVTDSPGMFDDERHAHRAINHPEFREKFTKLGEDKGFVASYLWSCGGTSVATLKPARTLKDFEGRKIRVLATPLERAVMDKMGATGVPMPYTEVLPAMQRKVIDGVRSAITVMYPSKFWTVAKYITLTGMGQITCGQFLSNAWLKTLPKDLKDLVFAVGKDVTPHAGKWGYDLTRKAEKDWARDAEVIRLSDADKAELRKRVQPIADEILGSDPKTKDMYALLKKAAAATKQ
jgi:TRAP-type C4-dicarboxylate transport system substrate-binding protein